MTLKLEIPDGQVAVLLDTGDVVRGVVMSTGDDKENIKLIEECLANEYQGTAKIADGTYYKQACMYELNVMIQGEDDDEPKPNGIYIQTAVFYHNIKIINCPKCKQEQDEHQRFCVQCGACLT